MVYDIMGTDWTAPPKCMMFCPLMADQVYLADGTTIDITKHETLINNPGWFPILKNDFTINLKEDECVTHTICTGTMLGAITPVTSGITNTTYCMCTVSPLFLKIAN